MLGSFVSCLCAGFAWTLVKPLDWPSVSDPGTSVPADPDSTYRAWADTRSQSPGPGLSPPLRMATYVKERLTRKSFVSLAGKHFR